MKKKHVVSIIFLFAGLLQSCASNNLPDYTALGDVRVLALIINTPEANPGDIVTITPVLSDLGGKGRTLNYSVQSCLDPGVGIGVTPACAVPDSSNSSTGTVVPPAGSGQTFTGSVTPFSVTLPSSATIFAGKSSVDQFNGVNYLVFYTVASNGGASVSSFVRVVVSSPSKTSKNQNPIPSSVDFNGSPTSGVFAIPATGSTFRVSSPASSLESYQIMNKDGTLSSRKETLTHTWFISDGRFAYYRTVSDTDNTWTAPDPKPSGRGAVILVVSRDGRGGAAVQKVEMN